MGISVCENRLVNSRANPTLGFGMPITVAVLSILTAAMLRLSPVHVCLAVELFVPQVDYCPVLRRGLDRLPLAHLPALTRTGAQSWSALFCSASWSTGL